jgi:bacillithiol biosynthesis deacetylase BshB1
MYNGKNSMDSKDSQTTLDILVFGAHPDDAELGCGGSIAKWTHEGYKVGIIDLTEGELATRGTPEIRKKEALLAKDILKVSIRENLGLSDGFFENNSTNQLKIIQTLRKYQPKLVLINAPEDRHPDHGRAAKLCIDAIFLCGLRKIETYEHNTLQNPWRPSHYMHYIQDKFLIPNIVVDITSFMETKMLAIQAYQSQFYNPQSKEPSTYISTPEFWDNIYSRAMEMGRFIGTKYGEGFILPKPFSLKNISDLF